MNKYSGILAFAAADFAAGCCEQYGVYPKSFHSADGCIAFLWHGDEADFLVVSDGFGFSGEPVSTSRGTLLVAPLNHANACALRKVFPFTAPSPVLKKDRTAGTGDRLGIATPGHIRVFETYDAYPVFAQQSIRELNLTGRSFADVVDRVSFAVFQEDYRRGFGADGDHLKKPDEVRYALECGCTMITLDCSEHIHDAAAAMADEEVMREYRADPELEARYINKSFAIGNHTVTFTPQAFRRMCLIYNEAIDFAVSIYERFIRGSSVDFEISIDETSTATLPEQHFYIASELYRRGVEPATVAPRFVGEFQKGIDYIGDLALFEKDFAVHAAIADHFGYKLSIHSGSDKLSVFPIIGKHTHGRFHLKTAGTSWLEAMAIVAKHDPALYREIHDFILPDAFNEARKYYHVTTNLNNIPPLSSIPDGELVGLLETNNDERQLVHITYGLILNEKAPDGSYRFRDRLYRLWRQYQEEYMQRLERHIGQHLKLLYSGFSKQ